MAHRKLLNAALPASRIPTILSRPVMASDVQLRPSSVVRCSTAGDGGTVYVKQYVTNCDSRTAEVVRARALREADLAARLAALPAMCGRLRAQKVVELDRENAVIVTA